MPSAHIRAADFIESVRNQALAMRSLGFAIAVGEASRTGTPKSELYRRCQMDAVKQSTQCAPHLGSA